MTTARDVVTFALIKSGVTGMGRSPSASQINLGMTDLNDMIALWRRKRYINWDTISLGVTSTGALTYTAGPGGDFNITPRPTRIAAAYFRNLTAAGAGTNGPLYVDTPIKVIPAREEYDRIAIKNLGSFTQYVFLDTTYPLATVRPYPVPQATIYQLFLTFSGVLPTLTPDTDMDTWPAEYVPALKFNLARWMRQAYGKGRTPDTELNAMALYALNTIKDANLQVPEMVMPRALVANSPGYNILSDQF